MPRWIYIGAPKSLKERLVGTWLPLIIFLSSVSRLVRVIDAGKTSETKFEIGWCVFFFLVVLLYLFRPGAKQPPQSAPAPAASEERP